MNGTQSFPITNGTLYLYLAYQIYVGESDSGNTKYKRQKIKTKATTTTTKLSEGPMEISNQAQEVSLHPL